MKKIYSLLMLTGLMLTGLFFTTSCSNDDSPVVNLSKEVSGSYKGYVSASCAYFSDNMSDDQTITLTESSVINRINIRYTSSAWGTFCITDAIVAESAQGYIITGEGTCKMGMENNVKDYTCSITGNVDVKKSSPSFVFNVPAVMGGLTITFKTGDMPSADE